MLPNDDWASLKPKMLVLKNVQMKSKSKTRSFMLCKCYNLQTEKMLSFAIIHYAL